MGCPFHLTSSITEGNVLDHVTFVKIPVFVL